MRQLDKNKNELLEAILDEMDGVQGKTTNIMQQLLEWILENTPAEREKITAALKFTIENSRASKKPSMTDGDITGTPSTIKPILFDLITKINGEEVDTKNKLREVLRKVIAVIIAQSRTEIEVELRPSISNSPRPSTALKRMLNSGVKISIWNAIRDILKIRRISINQLIIMHELREKDLEAMVRGTANYNRGKAKKVKEWALTELENLRG